MSVHGGEGTAFVVGDRTYNVHVVPDGSRLAVKVTVTMDGRFEWTLEEPGWRPLSFGASGDIAYLWSARQVVVLPRSFEADPEIVDVDEDVLQVFLVDAGWLLVCETSIRRIVDRTEAARIELGEVVEYARWEGNALLVRDARGQELRIRVEGGQLIT